LFYKINFKYLYRGPNGMELVPLARILTRNLQKFESLDLHVQTIICAISKLAGFSKSKIDYRKKTKRAAL
jgi:hypothetical protein